MANDDPNLLRVDISGGFASESVPEPTIPSLPGNFGNLTGTITGNMDLIHPGNLIGAFVFQGTDTGLDLRDTANPNIAPHLEVTVGGNGLTYSAGQLVGGAVTQLDYLVNSDSQNLLNFNIVHTPNFAATLLPTWVATDDAQGALSTILGGADRINGSSPSHIPGVPGDGADLIRTFGGNDTIDGNGGPDSIFGGDGDDIILDADHGAPSIASSTYLRGEAGDDYIVGGAGFDDANGNMGNDTISTGAGDDYSVGGKDNDLLFGGDGNDIVWGNLGNDTCDGGAGNDQVRGGQGDDAVFGGAGNDFVSGDRGNDTESGGAGADLFHGSQDAGIDRVLDFNLSEGDRVELDPGTTYTVSQVGADTVIDMGASNGAPNQMILVGVQMSTLTGNWIFLG